MSSWFHKYHGYDSHVHFLHRLAAAHPSVSRGIHLFGRSGPWENPAIVFFGTAHAREWISTMVAEYIAYSLLSESHVDADIKHALDSFDFYIFPVVNPDGLVYSQTKRRMWRKNRQAQNGTSCVGRDLNRNWDIHWGQNGGSSASPCHGTYRGQNAFDAPETRALAMELEDINERQGIRLFIDWHAFGQLVMHPYGYSCNKSLPPFSATAWLAGELAEAMRKVHGTKYKSGTACNLLYATSGDSADFVFEVLGADYAYTVELRPGRLDQRGFRLPENEIMETAEEAWGGVKHMLNLIHHY
ncbi:hypothetical protein C8A05DRAFT_42699 [Staphylotrichum tortipilum]|uniref:Peptidase M14 domain-containing protein n=1 Tax=Staphylotrichum tortipilum TaxID=2831512 RepID=A0AAN6RV61_9PEZI|nr:hypothetical protein C8A05DRAFT_42699 [Staphylotrichum longicolle]